MISLNQVPLSLRYIDFLFLLSNSTVDCYHLLNSFSLSNSFFLFSVFTLEKSVRITRSLAKDPVEIVLNHWSPNVRL